MAGGISIRYEIHKLYNFYLEQGGIASGVEGVDHCSYLWEGR